MYEPAIIATTREVAGAGVANVAEPAREERAGTLRDAEEPSISIWSTLTARGRWIAKARTSSAAVVQTIITKGLLLVINLVTGIIVARALAPAGRGEQAAMAVWPGTLSFLFLLGIPVSLVFNARRFPAERRELYSTALVLVSLLGLAATLAGEFIIPLFLTKYSPPVIAFARLTLVFTLPLMLLFVMQAMLEERGDFSTSNLIRYVPPVFTLAALVGLGVLHRLTPYTAVVAYAAPALMTFYIGWRVRAQFVLPIAGFRAAAGRLLHYGSQSYAIDLINQFSLQTAVLLVVGQLKPAELGIYTVALNVAKIVNVLHSSLNVVLFPKAASLTVEAIVDLTGRAARISTGLTVVLGIVFMAAVPVALPLLYGHVFRGAVFVTCVLVVESVISGITSVLAQAFMAHGRPSAVAVMQGAGTLLAIPLMLALIPRYGIVGAAYALLASTAARFALALVSFPLVLHVRPPSLLMHGADVRYLRERLAVAH